MSLLTRKYPFPKSRHLIRDLMVYSAIVFLILYLLQPFGFSMYRGSKLLVSLLFGAVTFCCCCTYVIAMTPVYKRVSPWRLWHEALSVLTMLLLIGVCNFFVFSFVFHYALSLQGLLLFLYWTLIIGIIITVCSVSVNYYRYVRNQLEALLQKTTSEQADIVVSIHDTNVRGSDLQLPINDLLYVEAQKNNVVVNFIKDGRPTSVELHTTLSAVMSELAAFDNIFQCHRSFVVNVNNITSAHGNSNGYLLKLGTSPTSIPVSRSYVPRLKSFIA